MNNKHKKQVLAISRLANCNPFSPTRFEIEKEILGRECEPLDSVAWNRTQQHRNVSQTETDRPNVIRLTNIAADLVHAVRAEKENGRGVPEELRNAYWDVATYLLLYRHITKLPARDIWADTKQNQKRLAAVWREFWLDYQVTFDVDGDYPIDEKSAAHLFACLTQVHRAFFNIFDFILGESLPIARLRGKVWESVFTCDIRRYHRSLFNRMRDLSTLVTGPSGTGKELVARAIGLSQYVPFKPATSKFAVDPDNAFLPLNLSALSPTLIESELFGHHRGAFTGAIADRVGWLEACSEHGAVFLDEIGELDLSLQVKLLRVVQERVYCRLGEVKLRKFTGKIVAATNRDLSEEIQAGRFREDFYFRLCTDRIQTPSLREQLDDRPGDLLWLVTSIVDRNFNENENELAEEIANWIESNLGTDYPWKGNIRELEQCVSSYVIRKNYTPVERLQDARRSGLPWLSADQNELTADQLLIRYCTWLYSIQGSFEKTARIVKLDRRTVKSKINAELLEQFRASGTP
ncbi:MAG: sigma-54-dependent transcriptional regulator [Mariniblastus sp.]